MFGSIGSERREEVSKRGWRERWSGLHTERYDERRAILAFLGIFSRATTTPHRYIHAFEIEEACIDCHWFKGCATKERVLLEPFPIV